MGIYNIVGDDTLTLFGRVLNDFADGDISTFTFNNDRSNAKTGKNGNTIFPLNETGKNAVAVLRIMKGSSDDSFLQGKLTQSDNNYSATELASGEFVKNLGDGAANIKREVFALAGGMITRYVDSKSNVEGDAVQGVSIYNFIFAKATRSIQ